MIEHPRADELIEAVAGGVESIRPQLNPRDAFLSRVAVNALNAVKRELVQGPAAEAAAVARLSALLGMECDLKALTPSSASAFAAATWTFRPRASWPR